MRKVVNTSDALRVPATLWCVLCNSDAAFRLSRTLSATHVALQCRVCGQLRMWPPADQQDTATDAHLYRAGEEVLWRWFAQDILRWLTRRRGTAPGTMLDVGCSTGGVVQYFSDQGWRAVGIDADARAVGVGRERGRDLCVGGIESVEERFDVILLNHVFEHLADPRQFLSVVRERLTPGSGVLYVVVPNPQSFARWWDGERWGGWGARQHEWLFSERGMRRLLAESGYECVASRQRVHRGWPGPGWWKTPFWWKRAPVVAMMRLSALVNRGDGLYVLARPMGPTCSR